MVPGTGVMLNNEMDDFAAKPGVPNGFRLVGADANAIAPGKRPLSSMTPTFVEKSDGVMVLGTPGGSYIMGMVLLATLDWLDGTPARGNREEGPLSIISTMPDTVVVRARCVDAGGKGDAGEVRPHAARVATASATCRS